jgi:hypothetical protein
MRRKKKSSLPRVTVMAYSRRDLVAFATAVDSLRGIAEELRIETALLRQELAAAKSARKRKVGGSTEPRVYAGRAPDDLDATLPT